MRRLIIALALIPLVAFAQEDSLRAQIRADLMQDPRTAELAPAELDALVEAIAVEAVATGEDEAYLDAKTAPTFMYDPLTLGSQNPYLVLLSAPIVIAVLAFLAAILGIIWFIVRRRHSPPEPEPGPSLTV